MSAADRISIPRARGQAKLAANAVARQVRLKRSPAIPTGRIFDDRGSRMTPTHSNKCGVRYRCAKPLVTGSAVAYQNYGGLVQNLQIFGDPSSLENVMVGGHLHRRHSFFPAMFGLRGICRANEELPDCGEALMRRIGLGGQIGVGASSMSYGMLKRLETARALLPTQAPAARRAGGRPRPGRDERDRRSHSREFCCARCWFSSDSWCNDSAPDRS